MVSGLPDDRGPRMGDACASRVGNIQYDNVGGLSTATLDRLWGS